jgi:hypothetical protein
MRPHSPGDVVAGSGLILKEAAVKLRANVGNLDLIVRVGGGLALVMLMALGLIGAWGLIGVVLIVTGVARWCPPYRLLGVSTLSRRT